MKKRIGFIITIGFMMVVASLPVQAALTSKIPIPNTKGQFTGTYSSDPTATVSTYSRTGNWARSTGLKEKTYQAQLDEIIDFLDKVYQDENEAFTIFQGISLSEANNMEGIQYLYDHSAVYRDMATVSDTLHIASKSSFSRGAESGTLYDRAVFWLEESSKLDLAVEYTLTKGRLSLWVISPDGETLYQHEPSNQENKSISLTLEPGLHSIVLVYELDYGLISGDWSIQGRISDTRTN